MTQQICVQKFHNPSLLSSAEKKDSIFFSKGVIVIVKPLLSSFWQQQTSDERSRVTGATPDVDM